MIGWRCVQSIVSAAMGLKLFLLIAVVSVCEGCRQTASEECLIYEDFPKDFFCKSLEIPLDTAIFRYPFRIRVEGQKAVILDLHNSDYYFHLFSYPGFEPLTSFGRRGNSPADMLSGESLLFVNSDSLYTLDANKREIRRWSIVPGLNSVEPREVIRLEEDVLRALDFAMLNDSAFVIPDYSGKSRFCVVNRQGKIVSRHGKIPSGEIVRSDVSLPALAQAWRSFISYNPQNKVLAMVTQLGEVLEIYHMNDTIGHFMTIGPHGEPDFEISRGFAVPVGIMGFSDVYVAEKYIYTVFHGQRFKELYAQGDKALDGGKYIYVFDLEGNPVCKYTLDRNVYSLYLDESRGKFIALDVNSDQPIVEYLLPDSSITRAKVGLPE